MTEHEDAHQRIFYNPPFCADGTWPTPREVVDAAHKHFKPGTALYAFAPLDTVVHEPEYAVGTPLKIWSPPARSLRPDEVPEAALLLADGWICHTSGPIVVESEEPLRVGHAPFVRVSPREEAGRYLAHADGGRAVRCAHLRVDATKVDYSRQEGMSCLASLRVLEGTWYRPVDGGRVAHARVDAGRYTSRAPTNRRRKREQAKARRRARAQR